MNKTYSFTLHASRDGVADNRETLYSIAGANSGSATLNAANNVNNTVTISEITPNLSGEITVTVTAGPNNTNANHFAYLGVMEMTAVPEPSTVFLMATGTALILFFRRRWVG